MKISNKCIGVLSPVYIASSLMVAKFYKDSHISKIEENTSKVNTSLDLSRDISSSNMRS